MFSSTAVDEIRGATGTAVAGMVEWALTTVAVEELV
jgi:hypothetical protein